MRSLIATITPFLLVAICHGGYSNGGVPLGITHGLSLENVPVVSLQAENGTLGEDQIGWSILYDGNLLENCKIDSLTTGSIYRKIFSINNAKGIGIHLSAADLSMGSSMFWYSIESGQISGSFQSTNVLNNGSLCILPINGSSIVFECYVPYSEVSNIVADYVTQSAMLIPGPGRDFGDSVCDNSNSQGESATGAVIFSCNDGVFTSTGFFVRNLQAQGPMRKLFMTENWYPECDVLIKLNYTSANPYIVVGDDISLLINTGYVLLEINDELPAGTGFFGWRTDDFLDGNNELIVDYLEMEHHPAGDRRKYHVLDSSMLSQFSDNGNGLLIASVQGPWWFWEPIFGHPEAGSGGAPLTDQNGYLTSLLDRFTPVNENCDFYGPNDNDICELRKIGYIFDHSAMFSIINPSGYPIDYIGGCANSFVDTSPPIIGHIPPVDIVPPGTFSINVSIDDGWLVDTSPICWPVHEIDYRPYESDYHGIDNATLYYKTALQSEWSSVILTHVDGTTFSSTVDLERQNTYTYYIIAQDASNNRNETRSPNYSLVCGGSVMHAFVPNPYPTINDALDVISINGTAHLAAGTYDEEIDIGTMDVNIVGEEGNEVVIAGTITVDGGRLDLTNVTVQNLSGRGIIASNGSDITVNDCIIRGCRIEETSGYSRHGAAILSLNSDVYLDNVSIENNYSEHGVGGVFHYSAPQTGRTLGVGKLRFSGNGTGDTGEAAVEIFSAGGIINFDIGGELIVEDINRSGEIQVMLSLSDNSSRTEFSMHNCQFRFGTQGGSVVINSEVDGDDSLILDNIVLENTLLDLVCVAGTAAHITVPVGSSVHSVNELIVENSIFVGSHNEQVVFSPTAQNWLSTPEYSDPLLSATGEPKWNSPCLDLLTDVTEFDLTNGDLGWKPRYPSQVLTTLTGSDLVAGNYRVMNNAVLSAPDLHIAAGANIRMEGGSSLDLWSTSGSFTMGSLTGPRTSIVAKGSSGGTPASHIMLGNDAAPVPSLVEGVLFHYAPSTLANPAEGYVFAGLMGLALSPNFGQPAFAPNVQFMKWDGCRMRLVNCDRALVEGVAFSIPAEGVHTNYPGGLSILDGFVTVSNCDFPPYQTGRTPLSVGSSSQSIIQNCIFDGSYSSNGPCLTQSIGTLSLVGNDFNNCGNTVYNNNFGLARMNDNAVNDFTSISGGMTFPFIICAGGILDLGCGSNRFVNTRELQGYKFIQDDLCTGNWDWSRNYWGRSTTLPLACDLVRYPLVPLCANARNCLDTYNPPVYWCQSDNDPDMELWNFGQQAELVMEIEIAVYYYSELVRLYPESKYAPLAADRLKVIGKKVEGLSGTAKSALLTGATMAASQSEPWLAAMESVAAQVVEARYGDRDLALTILDSLRASADSLVAGHAAYAQLEIATFPLQGGVSNMNPAAVAVARRARLDAWDVLVNQIPPQQAGQTVTADQPTAFELGRIYPNPFNPRTQVEVLVPATGALTLKVFNMAGQQVQILQNGLLPAGLHEFTLDGTRLASGLYLVQAEYQRQFATRKVLLLK